MNSDTEQINRIFKRVNKFINKDYSIDSDRFDDLISTDKYNKTIPYNPLSSTESPTLNTYSNNYYDIDSYQQEYTPVIEPSTVDTIIPNSDIFKSSHYTPNNIINIQSDNILKNTKPKYKLYSDSSRSNNSQSNNNQSNSSQSNNKNYSNYSSDNLI